MADKEKAQAQLQPGCLREGEFSYTSWEAEVEYGIHPDDVMEPAYWANYSMQLKPFDEVRARARDGTWIARLLVLDTSRAWTKMYRMELHQLTTPDVSISAASDEAVADAMSKYELTHRGPHRWSIIRKSDGAVQTEGHQQKDDAKAWLVKHAKAEVMGTPEPI